jgi:hypothetical protein
MSRTLITVKTLAAQARNGRAIEIAADALVTPAAADWLAATQLPVRRLDAAPVADPTRDPALSVVADGSHPNVRTLLPLLERQYGPVAFWSCRGHVAGLMEALQHAFDALAGDPARRCVVVMRDGSIAHCVSNRQPHVRAAIATRPSHLTGLMRNLGINMLILEHERISLRQMQGMIETFTSGATSLEPAVAAALGDGTGAAAASSPPGSCRGCTSCESAKSSVPSR